MRFSFLKPSSSLYIQYLGVLFLLLITGCINNVEDLTLADSEVPLPSEVSYINDIQPIFNARCVSCHGGTAGVFLSNYTATINSIGDGYGTNIVVPGDPDNSPLVDKIEPNPTIGFRMPSGGALTNQEILKIRAWIEAGAENN